MSTIDQVEPIIEQRSKEVAAFVSGTEIAVIKDQGQYDKAVDIGKQVKKKN